MQMDQKLNSGEDCFKFPFMITKIPNSLLKYYPYYTSNS